MEVLDLDAAHDLNDLIRHKTGIRTTAEVHHSPAVCQLVEQVNAVFACQDVLVQQVYLLLAGPKLTEVCGLDGHTAVLFRGDAKAVVFTGASSGEAAKSKLVLRIEGVVWGGVFDLKGQLVFQINAGATNLHLSGVADHRQLALRENL